MQLYDLIMIVVLGGATLFGLMKGMAWQMASLGSIIVSYFVVLNFSEPLAPMFGTQAPWNKFLAMAVLYTLSSFAVWLAFRFVASAIDRVRLKEFDRQIGALFGAFKGALLCLAITFFAVTLSAGARAAVLKSRSGVYIAQALNKADAVMPRELHEVLDPYMDRLERGLDPDEPGPTMADGEDLPGDLRDRVGKSVGDTIGQAVKDTFNSRFGKTQPADDSGWSRSSNRAADDRSEQPSRAVDDWGRKATEWSRRAADEASDAVDDVRESYEDEEFPPRRFPSTADDAFRSRRYDR